MEIAKEYKLEELSEVIEQLTDEHQLHLIGVLEALTFAQNISVLEPEEG